jgi:uncharacterized membrane protein YeaQ/YmgE (transglycosylase-associated protein family)
MPLGGFAMLLVIAIVVAAVLHYGLKFYVRNDLVSVLGKIIVAYVGAWLGTPLFGFWGPVYGANAIVPAVLGALASLVLAIDLVRTLNAAKAP